MSSEEAQQEKQAPRKENIFCRGMQALHSCKYFQTLGAGNISVNNRKLTYYSKNTPIDPFKKPNYACQGNLVE